MLGNFTYCNPTKLYFGDKSLENLDAELSKYGPNVALVYGGGSVKKSGLYDQVIEILKRCGKNVAEIEGVMPNPTLKKLREGIEIARAAKVDFILAVGGGSVCDYSPFPSIATTIPGRSITSALRNPPAKSSRWAASSRCRAPVPK